MGRHAVPGDEPDPSATVVEVAVAVPAVTRPTPRGR
ncbi:MAG: hypothetical protein JWQ77_683, partial [Jatrophihabitans sp.]|nr:hypothetical protein [Jatrophihabitans sp.]